jgi:hypothetical protein
MNKIIAVTIIAFLLAFASKAKGCDTGKGTVAPVKVVISKTQVDVPFDYRDCTQPTVSFTVITQKKSRTFQVWVTDITTGVVYRLDPYRPTSDTFAFDPLPAAGHLYVVSLGDGAQGKIGADIYAR